MPNAASRTRITPASPPGPITVPARTVESYCSYTQRFDATGGWSSRGSSAWAGLGRSEEDTSELQSLAYLVCRLLLEKKKKTKTKTRHGPRLATGHSTSLSTHPR